MAKWIRNIVLTIIGLIVAFVILIAVASFFINHTKNNGKYFSAFASDLVHKPVLIQQGTITLFSTAPGLFLQNVTFISADAKSTNFHADNLKISLNILDSLKERKWITKEIVITNLKINANTENTADEKKKLIAP